MQLLRFSRHRCRQPDSRSSERDFGDDEEEKSQAVDDDEGDAEADGEGKGKGKAKAPEPVPDPKAHVEVQVGLLSTHLTSDLMPIIRLSPVLRTL